MLLFFFGTFCFEGRGVLAALKVSFVKCDYFFFVSVVFSDCWFPNR